MQARLLEALWRDAKFRSVRLDPGEGGSRRLLHDITELAGEDQLLTALHDANLDGDHVTADWRYNEACRRTDLVVVIHLAVLVALWPEPGREALHVDLGLAPLLFRNGAR